MISQYNSVKKVLNFWLKLFFYLTVYDKYDSIILIKLQCLDY